MNQSPEIEKIRRKIITSGWAKRIKNIKITGLHGLDNLIEFKFPICTIVGENGTGKSTILKLAACAYKNRDQLKTFYPASFFPETTWDQVRNVFVNYEVALGSPPSKKYILKKEEVRWRGDILNRPIGEVFYFDLSRAQPPETMVGYSKIAKRSNAEVGSRDLSQESIARISSVMSRQYSGGRYATTNASAQKEIGILGFSSQDISQFHQGTGESTITDILSVIENAPNNSLVIIDEIETSLHPQAQRRLIRQLLHLTRTKTLQIIISTHSPYVLSELPEESRILLTKTSSGIETLYAPSVNLCLTTIDDELHPDLDIIVEDEEASGIVLEIIRKYYPEANSRIRVIPAGPDNIVRDLAKLSSDGKIPYKMIGVLDADQNSQEGLYKLFGTEAPERQVIKDVHSSYLPILANRLGISEEILRSEIGKIIVLPEHHEWLNRMQDRFNMSKVILWSMFVSIWVEKCLPENSANELVELVKMALFE